MDDQTTSQRGNRCIREDAYGDSAAEPEMNALDAAREFFCSDVVLHIVRDYQVVALKTLFAAHPNAGDKKWYARVRIEVED